MAKTKAKKSGNAGLESLRREIQTLKLKSASSGKQAGKKKNKGKKKKGAKKGLRSVRLTSDFSRAFLDPFSISGARVPDGSLVKTSVASIRYVIDNGRPRFNFTSAPVYQMVSAAPLWPSGSKPLIQFSSTAGTSSWFDYTNNSNPGQGDLTKSGALVASSSATPLGGTVSYRVTGGGVRLKFTNIPPPTPADVYVTAKFNGERMPANYEQAANRVTRHWSVKGDDELVIPFPIRSMQNSFEWINSGRPGSEVDDYPRDDDFTAQSQLRASIAFTASADNTGAIQNITGWSMQGGLGGLCICYRLPPGAAVAVESIVHIEGIPSFDYNNVTSDTNTKVELSNASEVEAVCNAASLISQCNASSNRGATTPLEDLMNLASEIGNQAVTGVQDAIHDTQTINSLTYGLAAGVGAYGVQRLRHRMLTG